MKNLNHDKHIELDELEEREENARDQATLFMSILCFVSCVVLSRYLLA